MPPFTRSGNQLQCFDERRYFMPHDHNRGCQCIAPAAARNNQPLRQCSWDISRMELFEIVRLTVEAAETKSNEVKLSILERIILLRVCGDVHREKLQEKFRIDLDCRDRFLNCYLDRVTYVALRPRELEREFADQIRQYGHADPVRTDRSGNVRNQHRLPSRIVGSVSRPIGPYLGGPQSIFVPYPSRPEDNMNDVLQQPIPGGYDLEGYVYALTWPASPGYIKIGYSGISVESRIAEIERCQSGVQILHAVHVPFPRRIERLLHLELSSARHQIIYCPACTRTHYEWFRVPEDVAIRALVAWKTLTEHDGLYTHSGHLLTPWTRRVKALDSAATAQALLDVRKAEAEAEAEAEAVAATRKAIREAEEMLQVARELAARNAAREAEHQASLEALRVQAALVADLEKVADAKAKDDMMAAAALTKTIAKDPVEMKAGSSLLVDWDAILDGFGDFMRMILINVP